MLIIKELFMIKSSPTTNENIPYSVLGTISKGVGDEPKLTVEG
jgi:hypothetical protein